MGRSDYLHPNFVPYLRNSQFSSVVEVGCKDGKDSVLLRDFLQCKIISFECNPYMIPLAQARFREEPDVQLVEMAAWDQNGEISFFPVIEAREGDRMISNYGASSCFRARSDYHRLYKQTECSVNAVRLDHFCSQQEISSIDLLCMDVQGAALHVLRGLGDMLKSVHIIVSEIEHREIYHDQDLFPEVDSYLRAFGFRQIAMVPRDDWFSDYLYINLSWKAPQS